MCTAFEIRLTPDKSCIQNRSQGKVITEHWSTMQVKCLLLVSSVRACMLNHLTTAVKKRKKETKTERKIEQFSSPQKRVVDTDQIRSHAWKLYFCGSDSKAFTKKMNIHLSNYMGLLNYKHKTKLLWASTKTCAPCSFPAPHNHQTAYYNMHIFLNR